MPNLAGSKINFDLAKTREKDWLKSTAFKIYS